MKLFDGGLIVIVIIGVALIAGAVSVKFFGNNNPVEEAAEEVVQLETGVKPNFNETASPKAPNATAEAVPVATPTNSSTATMPSPVNENKPANS